MPWTAFIDGGSRGNPGPAACGVVLYNEQNKVVFAGGFFLGKLTNNQAEYHGLLSALDLFARAKAKDIAIQSDSELLVRQINGQYRVKSPDLRPLFEQAQDRLSQFTHWKIGHILREGNDQADALANRAMDNVRDVVAVDEKGLMPAGTARVKAPEKSSGPQTIQVAAMRGADGTACPANIKRGQTFIFGAVTPAGLCVDGCAAVIEAVLALQGADELDASSSITPKCQRAGCGAVFEVRPAKE